MVGTRSSRKVREGVEIIHSTQLAGLRLVMSQVGTGAKIYTLGTGEIK